MPPLAGDGPTKNEHEKTEDRPTWGGLLFNVNLLLNAAYLIGTLVLFAILFGPLLESWTASRDLVEWCPNED